MNVEKAVDALKMPVSAVLTRLLIVRLAYWYNIERSVECPDSVWTCGTLQVQVRSDLISH